MVTVAISGGGTGGHITPALAVGEALMELTRDSGAGIRYYSTDRPVDELMYESAGVDRVVIDSPRLDTGTIAGRLTRLPFRAMRALSQARRSLRETGADVAFGTGGYSSFFVLLAARTLGLPTALHDSNSLPGRANRLAARFCTEVYAGFRSANRLFGGRAIITGNPVRRGMISIDPAAARRRLGLDEDRFVLLFLGGSQGASFLNDLALASPSDVSVIIQSGERDFGRVSERAGDDPRFLVVAFHHFMPLLYSAADLVIARAGAMTLAEIEHFGMPSILVPYPFAKDDHQSVNASEFCEGGRGVVIRQEEADPDTFHGLVASLRDEGTGRLAEMRRALAATPRAESDPAVAIATRLLRLAERGAA